MNSTFVNAFILRQLSYLLTFHVQCSIPFIKKCQMGVQFTCASVQAFNETQQRQQLLFHLSSARVHTHTQSIRISRKNIAQPWNLVILAYFNYLDTHPVRCEACRYHAIVLSSIQPNDRYLMVSIRHPSGRCYVSLPVNSIPIK